MPPKENEHEIELVFVINGEDYPVEANSRAPLVVAVEKALTKSQNTGRPIDEWEVRDIHGVLLDKSQTPHDLGLKHKAHLFLSLRVGAGGN